MAVGSGDRWLLTQPDTFRFLCSIGEADFTGEERVPIFFDSNMVNQTECVAFTADSDDEVEGTETLTAVLNSSRNPPRVDPTRNIVTITLLDEDGMLSCKTRYDRQGMI